MAGKRRVVADSDEEGPSQQNASASKRARTVGFDSEPEVYHIPRSPKKEKDKERAKSKAKARAQIIDDDNDADEEMLNNVGIDEEEEIKFEEDNTDRMWAAIEARRDLHGGIAEFGIIESIEMHQFMCHKALRFKFGEQINFIIGHNGSGKSAVLTAITVALGGKATSTGRGSGLKALIREGQSAAEVTIQLKNQGEEAFKPKEYGKSIFITRRFTKEGSSTWKIRGTLDGKIISTKKEELSAICDHMNIQVDNPMNVLTQDAARQFLSASQPSDKYKFFLRGTQLSQLSDEYDTCLENISQTTKALAQKKEAVPDLRAAFKEASARFEEASKARDQKQKADELKKELAWAHVAAKEAEMKNKIEELEKASRRLPRIQANIDTAKAAFDTATEEVTGLETEHRELGDITHLNTQKQALAEEIRKNKKKITSFTADMKAMDNSMKATRQTIEDYQKRIDEETRKMAVQTQSKEDETVQKLEQAKKDLQSADKRMKEVLERKRQKLADVEKSMAEGKKLEPQIAATEQKIVEIEETIDRYNKSQKDKYIAFGKNIHMVLQEMKKIRWRGEVIGPLGVHVRVKEPEKWAPLLRSLLGVHMSSFAITDVADRDQLKALLKKYDNPNVPIIIGQKDLFDYSRGEPPPEVTTVLRVLEIDDPWVLRILINAANIERSILAPTRREGQAVLSKISGGGVAWTADMFRVNVFPEGGGASSLIYPIPSKDPRQLLFSNRDAAGDMAHWKNDLTKAEQELIALKQHYDRHKQTHNSARREIDALSNEEREGHDTIRRLKALRDGLQEEANNDLPVALASLEAAKKDAVTEKESIMQQFEESMQQKAEVDRVQVPLIKQLDELRVQIGEFEEKRAAITAKIEEAVQKRMEATNSKLHYQRKLAEDQQKVDDIQKVADDLQSEFRDWTKEAELFCERFPNPRPVEVVKRTFESVRKALEAREKQQGATVEEMTVEVNKAKANLDSAQADLANMSKLNKALKRSLIIRLAKWQEFRRHIALRCKLVFQYHLSQRGYFGKVLFDHSAGTLQLKVQTEDKIGTQGPREKDPRSLSGGEKSFATICLLLSLWDSIGCPLRCLDEFDVFMDAVNRKISMRMMIETANASDKKQYILITPLDMNNVKLGPTVRVNRMPDPERGQGVLQRQH